jgi:hypothetical protein
VSGADPLLERLSRAAEVATGDDDRAATFARGLILGALVGAAIAGSTIWQRRRARPASVDESTKTEPSQTPG